VDMQSFLASIEGFLAAENYSIMWPIILIILTLSLGASAIAGEIEEGTMEIFAFPAHFALKDFFWQISCWRNYCSFFCLDFGSFRYSFGNVLSY